MIAMALAALALGGIGYLFGLVTGEARERLRWEDADHGPLCKNAGRPGNCNCFMICGHEPGSTPKCVRWKQP